MKKINKTSFATLTALLISTSAFSVEEISNNKELSKGVNQESHLTVNQIDTVSGKLRKIQIRDHSRKPVQIKPVYDYKYGKFNFSSLMISSPSSIF